MKNYYWIIPESNCALSLGSLMIHKRGKCIASPLSHWSFVYWSTLVSSFWHLITSAIHRASYCSLMFLSDVNHRKRSRGEMWWVGDGVGFAGFKEISSSFSFPGSLQLSERLHHLWKEELLTSTCEHRWKKGCSFRNTGARLGHWTQICDPMSSPLEPDQNIFHPFSRSPSPEVGGKGQGKQIPLFRKVILYCEASLGQGISAKSPSFVSLAGRSIDEECCS